MAKTRTVQTVTEEVVKADPDPPPEGEDVEGDDLGVVLAELGGDENAQVNVSRITKSNKKEYIGSFAPAEFTLEMLQEIYGGGDYVILGRRRNRITFNRKIAIAEPRHHPRSISTGTDTLATVIQEGFRQQNEQTMKLMMMMLGMKQGGGQAADPEQLRSGLLQDLQLMKSLVGSNDSNQALDAVKVMELIKMGVEFGRDAGGAETGPLDFLSKAMDTFGKPVARALERADVHQQAEAQTRKRQARAQRARSDRTPPPNAPNEITAMQNSLRFLIQQAQADNDPALWAEVVLDQVPEAQLRAFLNQPDPVAVLAALDSAVENHREWFQLLGQELRLLLAGDESNVPNDGNIEPPTPPSPKDQSHGDAGADP